MDKLETQLIHKRNEVEVAQARLSHLQQQIATKTKYLLDEQKRKLDDDLAKGKAEIEALHATIADLGDTKSALEHEIGDLNSKIAKLDEQVYALEKKVSDKSQELSAINKQIIMADQELRLAGDDLKSSKEESSKIDAQTKRAKEKLVELQSEVKVRQSQLDTINEDYAEKAKVLQLDVDKLELKKSELIVYIEHTTNEIDASLKDLATRQKAMEEMNNNLRLREAKVKIKEDKIVRNSQLLNL